MQAEKQNFIQRHAGSSFAILIGIVFIGIAIFAMVFTIPNFNEIGNDTSKLPEYLRQGFSSTAKTLLTVILSFAGILGGSVTILLAAFHVIQTNSEENIENKIQKYEESITKELQKGVQVRSVSNADEIWLNSTRILSDLAQKGYIDRQACDVTTYFNRVRYELMVAKCLESRVRFKRVFCFRSQNRQPSDLLMEWYLNQIQTGKDFKEGDIIQQDFYSELLLSFKEHDNDPGISGMTDAEENLLKKIIDIQRRAMLEGLLTITTVDRRMPIDFVVTQYMEQAGAIQQHEVQANFKTLPLMESYVAGIYAKGDMARHYQELFINIIEAGIL